MTPSDPFGAWAGRREAPRILFVGEAWGASEELHRAPFVGHSGKELIRMLGDAGVGPGEAFGRMKRALYAGDELFLALREAWAREAGVAFTNVFNLRPQDNKLEALCDPSGKGAVFAGRVLPPLVRSPKHAYLAPVHLPCLARLRDEAGAAKPNLVVALGAAALWGVSAALGHANAPGSHAEVRGTVLPGPPKTLPTFHPAYVLRQWSARSVTVADLIKSWRESAFVEFHRPSRRVLINPELGDLWAGGDEHLAGATHLSVDIETRGGQITSIGFATSPTEAIVVPFVSVSKDPPIFRSYWQTAEDERWARHYARGFLRSPIPKVFQNGLYDIQWLLRDGYAVQNVAEDTMLLHHAIHPEMRKGLGFLGSIYTDEPSWKLMRDRSKDDTTKAEE